MSFTNPYRNHNFLGNFASDAAALTFIQANRFDSTQDGLGNPMPGMVYYNTVTNDSKLYKNNSWVFLKNFDFVVDNATDLVSVFVPANAGKRIWVKDGTYSLSSDLIPPSYSYVLWGGGGTTGKVILDFGANNAYLKFATSVANFTTQYDATNSFTIANPTRLTIGSGAFPTMATPSNFYASIKTGVYQVLSRDSDTQLTLVTGPVIGAAAGNKPTGGATPVIWTYENPSLNVTMEGRLHITGTGAYFTFFAITHGLNTKNLTLSSDIRGLADTSTNFGPIFIQVNNSHIGPLIVEKQNISRAGTMTTAVDFISILRSQFTVFDMIKISDSVVTNTVNQVLTINGINAATCYRCIINAELDQIRGEGANNTRTLNGINFGGTLSCVWIGSVDDLSGDVGWTVNKTTGAQTDADITGLRVA